MDSKSTASASRGAGYLYGNGLVSEWAYIDVSLDNKGRDGVAISPVVRTISGGSKLTRPA